MSKVKNSQFYTLMAAAYSAVADLRADESVIPEFLKWAREGYQRFHFETSYDIRFAEIAMKPWKQIDWPEDMVDWTKIGFKVGDTIRVFTSDQSIPKSFDKVDCVPQENSPSVDISQLNISEDQIPFVGAYDFFTGGEHYYGALLNYNYRGYFDVDNRNRVFNFKRVVNNINTVYLEYITDGIEPGGQTIIPPMAFKSIVDYIHWQRREHADDPGAERAKRIFEDEFDRVLVYNLNLSLDDIKEAIWNARKQTPK